MTRRRNLIRTAHIVCCLTTISAPAAWASGNLLVNSNAEAGLGSSTGDVVAVPGWITSGNFTVATYDNVFNGPDTNSPGPIDRGLNYFSGGPQESLSSASQIVDLTPYQAYFSSNPFSFTLSGWFGGFGNQDDNAALTVSFRDAANNEIEFANTTPVYAADRSDTTGLVFVSTGWTPGNNININPASAVITLTMTRTSGSYDDGYADNLMFSVGPVPEPGRVLMMLAGLAGIGGVVRRRMRRA